ncbi:Outer membrane lipoprotein-sorting protein [hydrothermal vent metagenome]|uniref:Outer membrane lipoprotein-sorting protein n=1 Tax=hydrothermal vent metagenome TaxID=652676 RepID=A0A3B1A4W0_9ZZZZ
MRTYLIIFSIFATSFSGLSFNVLAETAEDKGLAISVEADKRDTGWGDQRATLVMTLKNRFGQESKRRNRNKTLEVIGDGDKTLIVFDSPKDIKGTAFLSFTHALKPDEQWIFLPALKRVKRISSSNKSGPFLGSEFSYEDISSQEVEKYKYKYLRDEKINGRDSFVVEATPQYKKSGYTRLINWVDKERYQPLKTEFYDRKNSLLKTLLYSGYMQYLNKYWRAGRLDMQNHITGKSTSLEFLEYKFRTGLKDRDFNRNALKRAR